MHSRVVRLPTISALTCWFVCVAAPVLAQEGGAEPLPQVRIDIKGADLQAAFLASQHELQPQRVLPHSNSEPRRPEPLVPLYASLIALQGLDIHSTLRAIDAGSGREANPVMSGVVKNSAAFIAVKAGATTCVIWASEKMWRKNRKAALILAAVANVALAAVAANNYRHGG